MGKNSGLDGVNDLNSLMVLDRSELIKLWEKYFGYPPPSRCGVEMLRGALAWQCQFEQLAREDKADVNRMLQRLQRAASVSTGASLTPGTRLLREWRGQTHHVTVLEGGYEYDGNNYKSLTAITRHITGMSWSGPKFFGLKQ